MNTDIRRTVQHRGHHVWKKETSEYLIPTEVQPAFEPAVEVRVHGVQQVETTATSTLAHVTYDFSLLTVHRCVDHRDDGDASRTGGR